MTTKKKKWVLSEKRLRQPYDEFVDSIKDKKPQTQARYKREWFNYRRNYKKYNPKFDHYTHTFYFICRSKYVSERGVFERTVEHYYSYEDMSANPDSKIAYDFHNDDYPDHTVISMTYHNTLPVKVG